MTDQKDRKKKAEEKDTDFTDEVGGGEDDVFTKEDFLAALKKVTRKIVPKQPAEGTGKTSE